MTVPRRVRLDRDGRLNREARWQEQLAAQRTNVCDCEEPCPPCARCSHAFCKHEDDGWLPLQCLVAGCQCRIWLSDSDCQDCDGMGFLARTTVACRRCRGTGLRTSNDF